MPGKANRNLAASVDDGDPFVFSWVRKHPGIFWLWGFLVLSLLLHATGFYLFQVVYPSSGRLEPFPAQVLILDKKNTANSVLLQELDDRLVFLQPASTDSASRKGIDNFSVSFQPSFVGRLPPFREPALLETTAESPATVPPLAAVAASSLPAGESASQRHWSLADDLSKRAMSAAQASSLDEALPSIGAGPWIVLDIVISASGEVTKATVKNGAEHPSANEFVEAVTKKLRFNPVAGNHSTKGELEIHP